MTDLPVVTVFVGIAVGVLVIIIFAVLLFPQTTSQTLQLPLEFPPDPDKPVISLSARVVGKIGLSKYQGDYLARLRDHSIVINESVLDRSPRLLQILEGADERYYKTIPQFGDQIYFSIMTIGELESIVESLPDQDRILVWHDKAVVYPSNTTVPVTIIRVPLFYNSTYHHVGAAFNSP